MKLFRTILFTVSALGGQRFSVEFDAQRRYLGQVARARLEGEVKLLNGSWIRR